MHGDSSVTAVGFAGVYFALQTRLRAVVFRRLVILLLVPYRSSRSHRPVPFFVFPTQKSLLIVGGTLGFR
jgi:hypothetical protein